MLMLFYADDPVLLAPNSSHHKTALEKLRRVARKWGMAVNYLKTEAVVFALPATAAAASYDPSWIQQRGSQASSMHVGSRCPLVSSIVQADGGQYKELQRRL